MPHGTGAYVDDALGSKRGSFCARVVRRGGAGLALHPRQVAAGVDEHGRRAEAQAPSVTTYCSESTAAPRDVGMLTPASDGVTVRPEALLMMWLHLSRSRRSLSAKDGSPLLATEAGAHGPCRCAAARTRGSDHPKSLEISIAKIKVELLLQISKFSSRVCIPCDTDEHAG